MNLGKESANTDEYYVTALQIFDYCGAESSGTLHVDSLMDKFAPFIKTNKSEYISLKALLDPDQKNPEINVINLATALHKYSESQKAKVDLDESFNLKSGQGPQDSDSGISTDGFQILEELQSELREKAHLAHQLRSQLDFTDRQHEEAISTLTAERDSLRAHLNMLREENISLVHVKQDYEETCDRLCGTEQALDEARRDLDSVKRKARLMHEQLTDLETEKMTLQELLTKSKDECHRINEMYATRQAALLEENETLKTEHADLTSRLQDQEEFMQQIIKEKVLLEIELKDVLNKSNGTQLRMDRSIDISYSEDQMLTELDSLNADSKFTQENRLLDEESFVNALREDQGRVTNMSLFDEIRLSFCNTPRRNNNKLDFNKSHTSDVSIEGIGTQTDLEINENKTEYNNKKVLEINCCKSIETQTYDNEIYCNNNTVHDKVECDECKLTDGYTTKLERDLKLSTRTVDEMQSELIRYEDNLNILKRSIDEGNVRNRYLQTIVKGLQTKITILEESCMSQRKIIDNFVCDTRSVECQAEIDVASISTQAELPCTDCEKRNEVVKHRSMRKFFWRAFKSLFQLFAVVCFACAVLLLYGVTRGWSEGCRRRDPLPWRWLDAHDLVDLLFRIEYVSDVPM